MIEYKDGILRLNLHNDIPDLLWSVSFFLFMLSVICFGSTTSGANYYYYFVFFLFIGVSLALSFNRRRFTRLYLPVHTVWYGLFIILSVISSIWADSFATSFVPLSKILQILAVTYCLILYIDSEEKLERYIYTVLAASVFLILFIYVRTPPAQWFAGFLGSVTRYNTNDVGCAISICVLLSFYEGYIKHKKLCFAICAFSFLTVILTSSRKSLFMSALGIIMIVMFNYRARNYFLRLLCILAAGVLAFVLIYQIPSLYNTVGVRLDSMVEYFMNDKSADYSIALRRFYIDISKSIFAEHPLLGAGFNNFSYLIRSYNRAYSYAHNNYWEILAGLGIVGFITYYWFYVYLFLKLFRQIIDGHKSALLFTPLILLFIVFEYGMVDYYKMQVHLVLAAMFCAVSINDTPVKKPSGEEDDT